MTMPFVRVDRVTKRFEGQGGIAGLSLDVSPGEAVVVVGPSGSGKTTLLRLIAGLDRPDAGAIWLEGRKVSDAGRTIVAANERRIGFVFQDLALWPHLTVRGNLDFVTSSRIGGRQTADGIDEIDEVLRVCRVAPSLVDRYPHQLSGGEQQRVALARAMVGSPRLLLFDEPFSSLDRELRAELRGELASLHRDLRFTAIYVTHDLEDAESLATRRVEIGR